MNVIISNKYKEMLDNLPIDIIKSNNGVFEVDDIIKEFQIYYFQRMVLDITAIKNYQDITNLQKLSINLDMDKVILVLDDSPSSMTPDYLSKLISENPISKIQITFLNRTDDLFIGILDQKKNEFITPEPISGILFTKNCDTNSASIEAINNSGTIPSFPKK